MPFLVGGAFALIFSNTGTSGTKICSTGVILCFMLSCCRPRAFTRAFAATVGLGTALMGAASAPAEELSVGNRTFAESFVFDSS